MLLKESHLLPVHLGDSAFEPATFSIAPLFTTDYSLKSREVRSVNDKSTPQLGDGQGKLLLSQTYRQLGWRALRKVISKPCLMPALIHYQGGTITICQQWLSVKHSCDMESHKESYFNNLIYWPGFFDMAFKACGVWCKGMEIYTYQNEVQKKTKIKQRCWQQRLKQRSLLLTASRDPPRAHLVRHLWKSEGFFEPW